MTARVERRHEEELLGSGTMWCGVGEGATVWCECFKIRLVVN